MISQVPLGPIPLPDVEKPPSFEELSHQVSVHTVSLQLQLGCTNAWTQFWANLMHETDCTIFVPRRPPSKTHAARRHGPDGHGCLACCLPRCSGTGQTPGLR